MIVIWKLRAEEKISVIGHSAGGWLARVYMKEFDAFDHIALLLTLGSPHLYDFSIKACMMYYSFQIFHTRIDNQNKTLDKNLAHMRHCKLTAKQNLEE